jgi:hypothetical protein
MGKGEKPDRACIRDFAAFLRAIGRPVDGVDCWPEDEAHGEIDAIVGSYAIQHTSVDALPRGREASARFDKVIGDLEGEFAGKLGFPLLIAWDWAAVQKGQQWGAIRDALRAWIASDEARNLPNGRHQITGAAGIPFRFDATKPARFGLDGVRFSRNDPKDTTFNERLHDQLAGRHKKLAAPGPAPRQRQDDLALAGVSRHCIDECRDDDRGPRSGVPNAPGRPRRGVVHALHGARHGERAGSPVWGDLAVRSQAARNQPSQPGRPPTGLVRVNRSHWSARGLTHAGGKGEQSWGDAVASMLRADVEQYIGHFRSEHLKLGSVEHQLHQKVLVVTMLGALARGRYPKTQYPNARDREKFINLVEEHSAWQHSTSVSASQLAMMIDERGGGERMQIKRRVHDATGCGAPQALGG